MLNFNQIKYYMKIKQLFILTTVALSALAVSCSGGDRVVKSPNVEITLSPEGQITSLYLPESGLTRQMSGAVELEDCEIISVSSAKVSGGGFIFVKQMKHTPSSNTCTVTDIFTPTENSVKWEVIIEGDNEDWSTTISNNMAYISTESVEHWLPWADPRGDISEGGTENKQIANAILDAGDLSRFNSWANPLVTLPLQDHLWHFGSPRYEYEQPGALYCPFRGDVVTIPMITFLEKSNDVGVSFVASIDDLILDLTMETTEQGGVKFSHFNHRIGPENTISFTVDIAAHKADWRDAMAWTFNRYTEYFMPENPLAQKIAGTGAYSNSDKPFDVDKMKKMEFGINWRASFDFPYMGMFIPPVETKDEIWGSFVRQREKGTIKAKPTSINVMQDYCRRMDECDFHVLSYFNVTEFGTQIQYPRPASDRKEGDPLWWSANDYLYENLADAMLLAPEKQVAVTDKGTNSSYPGMPYWTWEMAVAMDPGVESYQNFIVDQAERTVKNLPNSYGICIDRMDWTRFYNHATDDGVSWMGDQAVGSMHVSWHSIMDRLHEVFHSNNKVIFVNNHVKRIDQLRYVDGIFDEFTYAGSPTNTIGLMCTHKPALGWMSNDSQLKPDPDEVMQKYLFLGIYPMCPFPGNDHSMLPTEFADKVYLDYGPLLKLLKGKEWVFKSHVIEAVDNAAMVNLFKTFEGYTVPVMYAQSPSVDVIIRDPELTSGDLKVLAFYPGNEVGVPVKYTQANGELKISTGVERNCAMLKIEKL